MNHNSLRLLISLALFLLSLSLKASFLSGANEVYSWKVLSEDNGLTDNKITSMYKDSDGVVWIGTYNGLNMVIGNSIRQYLDFEGLQNKVIWKILEDDKKNIWVQCNDKLYVLNKSEHTFIKCDYYGTELKVYSICEVESGILIGSKNCIYKYDSSARSVSLICKTDYNIVIDNIIDLHDGFYLLLNYSKGLFLYDSILNRITKISDDLSLYASGVCLDDKLRLWIPTYNKGVINLDYLGNGKFSDFRVCRINSEVNVYPLTVFQTSEGEILLGTDGQGIWKYGKYSDSFNRLENIKDKEIPSLRSVSVMMEDEFKNLWVGNVRIGVCVFKNTGIYKWNINKSYYVVGCINIDKFNRGFVGLDSGGFLELDIANSIVRDYNEMEQMKIVSMAEYGDSSLLLSAYNRGLFLFNKDKKIFKEIKLKDIIHDDLFNGQKICYVLSDTHGIRLMAGNKIYKMDDLRINDNYSTVNALGIGRVLPIYDSDNKSKYGIVYKNVVDLYSANDTCDVLWQNDLPISAACYNSDVFYVADYCSIKIIKGGSVIKSFPVNYKIKRICISENDVLTVFSDNRVCFYNIKTDEQWMIDNIFYNKRLSCSYVIDKYGELLWGGVNGIYIKHNDFISIPSFPKKVNLLYMNLDNKLLGKEAVIELPFGYSNLNIKYSIAGKDFFSNINDRFILKGDNIELDLVGKDNSLDVYSLPFGTYKLFYIDPDIKELNRHLFIMEFKVNRPLWLSTYAIITYSLVFMLLIYIIVKIINKRRENEYILAMKEHGKLAAEEKVRFLINISHELRTPLTLIYSPIKNLIQKNDLSPELSQRLKKIYLQVKNMKDLIDLTLNARKSEVDTTAIILESININQWLKDLCEEFSLELEIRNIELKLELDTKNIVSLVDVNKCRIIISNIIMNAIKYGGDNNIIIVGTKFYDRSLRIFVEDRGPGINIEHKSEIFSRFYREYKDNDGYGIGLSYVKTLVEQHNGIIDVYNNELGGATFYIELPLEYNNIEKKVKDDIINSYHDDVKFDMKREVILENSRYSILLVDDEKEILNLLTEELSDDFRNVYRANNGEEALKLVCEKMPDIVVSDVMMPEMDGYELCSSIKNDIEISHIPVILLTARVDENSINVGYKCGADNYISKPFDVDSLKSIINGVILNREKVKGKYKSYLSSQHLKDATFSNADEKFVLKLEEFVEKNISDENLNIDSIALEIGVSKSLLHSKVKAILGVTVVNYITDKRISKAKELLLLDDLAMSQIAYDCGFSSQAYFTTVFKKNVGMTPLMYRKSKIKNTD